MDDTQSRLHQLLRELADISSDINKNGYTELAENAMLKEYAIRLRDIYSGDFRHRYSELFGVLVLFENKAYKYRKQYLIDNIRKINDYIATDPDLNIDQETANKIRKLDDHLSLDSARIDYTKQISEKLNDRNNNILTRINKISKTAENMQREYITILGIFSAIVITFVAGVVFSSSVLNNISKVSIYRLTFVMIMIAWFLINLLALLMDFIKKINQRGLDIPSGNANKKVNSMIDNINLALFFMLVIDLIWWGVYWWRFS